MERNRASDASRKKKEKVKRLIIRRKMKMTTYGEKRKDRVRKQC